MILDHENLFSDKQALTGTALSTNIVDLGLGDTGPAEGVSLFVSTGEGLTGATGLTVELQTADAVTPAGAMDSPVVLARYVVAADKVTKPGKLVASRLPHGLKRYARLNYTGAGSPTAGTLTAGLVYDVQADMPDPVTIGSQA